MEKFDKSTTVPPFPMFEINLLSFLNEPTVWLLNFHFHLRFILPTCTYLKLFNKDVFEFLKPVLKTF